LRPLFLAAEVIKQCPFILAQVLFRHAARNQQGRAHLSTKDVAGRDVRMRDAGAVTDAISQTSALLPGQVGAFVIDDLFTGAARAFDWALVAFWRAFDCEPTIAPSTPTCVASHPPPAACWALHWCCLFRKGIRQ